MVKIGERLTIIRNSHLYTQEKVAIAIGIHRSSYANIEIGKRELSFEEAIKLSAFYGISLDIMFSQEVYEFEKNKAHKATENIKHTVEVIWVLRQLPKDDFERMCMIQLKELTNELGFKF